MDPNNLINFGASDLIISPFMDVKMETKEEDLNDISQTSYNIIRSTYELKEGACLLNQTMYKIDQNTYTLIQDAYNLNQGIYNLNQVTNILNQGTNNFNQGTNNLNQGINNLNQGINNLNQGTNNLNQGTNNLNQVTNILNQGTHILNHSTAGNTSDENEPSKMNGFLYFPNSTPNYDISRTKDFTIIKLPKIKIDSDSPPPVIPESKYSDYHPVYSGFHTDVKPNLSPEPDQVSVTSATSDKVRLCVKDDGHGNYLLIPLEDSDSDIELPEDESPPLLNPPINEIPKTVLGNYGIVLEDGEKNAAAVENADPAEDSQENEENSAEPASAEPAGDSQENEENSAKPVSANIVDDSDDCDLIIEKEKIVRWYGNSVKNELPFKRMGSGQTNSTSVVQPSTSNGEPPRKRMASEQTNSSSVVQASTSNNEAPRASNKTAKTNSILAVQASTSNNAAPRAWNETAKTNSAPVAKRRARKSKNKPGIYPPRVSALDSQTCFKCSEIFLMGPDYQDHVARHCSFSDCPELFEEESERERHEKSHTDHPKKPFKCAYCKRRFHYYKFTRKHERICKHLKKSKCPHCKYTTSRVRQYNKHIANHIRRINCSMCKMKYLDIDKFIMHMSERHQMSVLFECTECPRRFIMWESITNHVANHGIDIDKCGIARFIQLLDDQ